MALFSKLPAPSQRLAKWISGILALVLLVVVAVSTMAGVLLYQILRLPKGATALDLTVMMGHPSTVTYSLDGGGQRDGWFFPGQRGAPTIILCHGYLSQRSDILTLASSLQEQQFNVFLVDYTATDAPAPTTTLGYKEAVELRSAVQALSARDDVDPNRFGVWGVDMGAYAALELALRDKRVAALVLDSAYSTPLDVISQEVNRSGLSVLPLVSSFTEWGFEMLNSNYRHEPPVATRISALQGIPKLFIETDARPSLAQTTLELYRIAPPPKDLWEGKQRYWEMGDDDRRAYETLVVTFFLKNLPASSSSKR
jgi:uncharacterized protein